MTETTIKPHRSNSMGDSVVSISGPGVNIGPVSLKKLTKAAGRIKAAVRGKPKKAGAIVEQPQAEAFSPREMGIAAGHLKQLVERIERLEEEKRSLADDIKDVYGEAKANGFDTKIIRKVIGLRRKDHTERLEEEAITQLYLEALGME